MRRFIIFIVIFAVFLAFITFNLENKGDVSIGFKTFTDVPVFITVFTSFFFGILCGVPFIYTAGRKRREKPVKEKTGSDAKPIKDKKDSKSKDAGDASLYGID
ncbi:MAG: hypothetical protein LBH44_00715 [Treponema sp.]|jgi:uncharacterized integral membrane protein|nr:hypothetical protein [Treponema sp.]